MDRVPLAKALGNERPFVAMVHLTAVRMARDVDGALEHALRDARALAEAGADALLVENHGDAPFSRTVAPHTTAALALAARRVREDTGLPVGVNALRNDTRASLGAAAVAGGSFVRVNVLSGVMVTDQGIVEGDAAGVHAYRRELGLGGSCALLADVLSKHAVPFPGVTLADAAEEAWKRAGADALLVTGRATGAAADPADARSVRDAVPDAPVIVASGVTRATLAEWAAAADGVLVGTALKEGGRVHAPVDAARAGDLVSAWRRARASGATR